MAAALTVALLWLMVTAAALFSRPLLAVDETRYAAVAWEMWLRGDYLVPHLNGATYSHKPPLLFWLIDAGWLAGGGPSLLWLRLVGPLCAAVDLWLVHRLARRLWPQHDDLALLAPLVLLGTLLWTVYGTLLLFDTLLTACVLLALLGLLGLRSGRRRGAAMLAVGVGLGVLAKGPVVLLHVLPPALLAGWWDAGSASVASGPARLAGSGGDWPGGQARLRGGRWHAWVAAGVCGGALLALLWAVPAALAGGPVYGREIFLGQTTGRMVKSFAHRRPVWWYLPQLFWMLLPWWLWPALWRGARRLRAAAPADPGVRFCLAWAIPAVALFSLVSGKQVHYLIPELPAVALLVARALTTATPAGEGSGALPSGRPQRTGSSVLWPALALALPGVTLLVAGLAGERLPVALPPDLMLPPVWAAALLAIVLPAVALVGSGLVVGGGGRPAAYDVPGGRAEGRGAMALAAATVALVAMIHLVALPGVAPRYDLTLVSRHLRALEESGVTLAHVGPYSGQFGFLGRLRRPLQEIEAADVAGWLVAHPGGRVVSYTRDRPLPQSVEFSQRYGKGWVVIER